MIWPFKRRRPEPVDDVADLRHIDSVRVRIKGTSSLIPDREREHVGGREYVLRREPENEHDSNAVAIYSQGRKVGYVSAARAASLAPLLDRLGQDALINGMGAMTNSIRLWADLPRAAALRAYLDGK